MYDDDDDALLLLLCDCYGAAWILISLVNTKDSALFFKKVPHLIGETMVESIAMFIIPHSNMVSQTVVRVPPQVRQLMLIVEEAITNIDM